ncbi:MAG: hypothetical protein KJO17_12120 [Acidimicrobiia bacterium]|nr:hypothetical protein [Acidimicrobiia bacterium]
MKTRFGARSIEQWLVTLIALHSVAVGVLLVAFTDWSAAFGGWGGVEPRFFARQAGVFHIVIAAGYLYEYLRYRGIGLLVLAKSTAVVFLLSMAATAEPFVWIVPLSALADGLMAAAVLIVRHRISIRRG